MTHLRLLILVLLLSAMPTSAMLVNGGITVVGAINYGTSTTGSDAYSFNLPQAPTTPAYETGACFAFIADVANTGTATLNIHGIGIRNITKPQAGAVSVPLDDNDIEVGQRVQVCYDGTNFQCQNCDANAKPILLALDVADTFTDCVPGRRYDVPLAVSPHEVQRRCSLNGDALEPLFGGGAATIAGLHTDASGVLGVRYSESDTCTATDLALGAQRNHCFIVGTDGVQVTLPPVASAPDLWVLAGH